MNQPNIIVVLVDQMRRDALSCAGDPNVRTPNLDRLASRGVRFTSACSTFPACVPFRFSMVTGEYAHSRNVPALGYRLSPAEHTLGDALKSQGYATAYIGKWHLYSAYGVSGGLTLSQASRTPIPASHRRGFDYWRGFELRNDFYDTAYFVDDDPVPRRLPGHQTDGLFDLAAHYLEADRPEDQPFFLLLSVEAPHPPFMASEQSLKRVRDRGPMVPRPNVDLAAISFFPPEWHEESGPAGKVDPDDPASVARVAEANMQAYYAMIEMIDDNMGKLDTVLEQTGLADNTVVVFLSDHGELGGSHGLLGKAEPWEESVGVPLIVAGPDRYVAGHGATASVPVNTEDLFPTFVGLTGGSASARFTGMNLAPFIRGECAEPVRDGVLLEFVTETRSNRSYYDETWRGIRSDHLKYTVIGDRAGARPWQLFDLSTDPYEMNNLVDQSAGADLAADMHGRLIGLLDRSGDDYALAPAFGHPARNAVVPDAEVARSI
ncbi:sulfatase [Hoeflea sp. G2-23]|uniref:Sulfatase n=1 Tax=Hoeflea algicola TaxID=2983763 RepID=A0ABT3ZGP8_9HYPH|nr:sulfatase [Hoeflea algicola]MCY0150381.1 sulfatase [Hoeflea algicola]